MIYSNRRLAENTGFDFKYGLFLRQSLSSSAQSIILVTFVEALVTLRPPQSVPDPDLEIRRGASHPDPYIRGGGLQKFFFGPSGLSLVLKSGGGAYPPGPSPGAATAIADSCITHLQTKRVSALGKERRSKHSEWEVSQVA